MSVLLAVVLSLQLYFTNRTQQKLLQEINRLSHSMNKATQIYYMDVAREIEKKSPAEWKGKLPAPDSVFNGIEFLSTGDSILSQIRVDFPGAHSLKSLPPEMDLDGGAKMIKDIRTFITDDSEITRIVPPSQRILRYKNKKSERDIEEKIEHKVIAGKAAALNRRTDRAGNWVQVLGAGVDSLSTKMETIEINLNKVSRNMKDSVFQVRAVDGVWHNPDHRLAFSFRVPDFSVPNAPRILQYNYNAEGVKEALISARNQNLLITLLIFLVSMGVILLVSNRFLRPIGVLKNSFDRVVNGNLEITVPARSRDEIGDLTRSFNHMVKELQKNREKEEILQRKERLASLGQLAAAVAHEIKNPLNAINLTIDHLHDKYASAKDTQVRKYIQTVQSEIRRLDKIVNNFLSFVRSENLQKNDTDLNELIQGVLELLNREFAAENITLSTHFPTPLVLPVDPERMKTVLMNIILNSIQAMPGGGELHLATDAARRTITISDTGRGIPEKELSNIFDLFYTTKSTGTGLGLPTAYKIVKEHGGEIRVRSEIGKGTEVEIELSGRDS